MLGNASVAASPVEWHDLRMARAGLALAVLLGGCLDAAEDAAPDAAPAATADSGSLDARASAGDSGAEDAARSGLVDTDAACDAYIAATCERSVECEHEPANACWDRLRPRCPISRPIEPALLDTLVERQAELWCEWFEAEEPWVA
jgi:hypothetical protein